MKIILFLLLINPAVLHADLDASRVRLEPLAIARRVSAGPDAVPADDFIDAALLFSGLDEAAFPAYRGKVNALLVKTKTMFLSWPQDKNLADELLQFLHKKYLSRYEFTQTSLPRLLDDGVYNCVSSSVLYIIAADALGLTTSGVRTADHAFVRVVFGAAAFDVETTSLYGFDPGRRKEFFNEFGKITGFAYSPPTAYADRKDIGRREMLSLILNNRIAELVAGRRYDEATGCGADIFELMKNEESLKLLSGVYSGLAQFALETAQFETGYTVLDRAVGQYRDFNQFQDLRRFFVHDWANRLVEKKSYAAAQALAQREHGQGKIPEDDYRAILLFRYRSEAEDAARDPGRGPGGALAIIEAAKKELGDVDSLLKDEKVYVHNHVLDLIEKGRFTEAEAALERYRADRKLDDQDYVSLTVLETQRRAEAVAGASGYLDALTVIEGGLEKTNQAPALQKSAGIYTYNWILKLIQSEAYDDAAALLSGDKAKAYLSAETRQSLTLYFYTARAEALRKKKDYPAAIAVIEQGLADLGRKPELLRSYEVAVHNRMIEFYDAKDYDQAEAVLLNGLAVYPASQLFKSDLDKVRKLKKQ